jgi:hypothetical protein
MLGSVKVGVVMRARTPSLYWVLDPAVFEIVDRQIPYSEVTTVLPWGRKRCHL